MTFPQAFRTRQNRLLALLPEADAMQWLRLLEVVDLPLGHVLYEPGVALRHAYFPTTAVVSLVCLTESGASAEIAVVGNDGVVGIPLLMGGETTTNRAVVRSAGMGFRLSAMAMQDGLALSGTAQHVLLRYAQALITQTAQMAVCNRHHSLEQQLSRWLLQTLDRVRGDELIMTHEHIANMLGVRRESVTAGALRLQRSGMIRYTRGRIAVLDRAGLEDCACECYGVMKDEYERLLSIPCDAHDHAPHMPAWSWTPPGGAPVHPPMGVVGADGAHRHTRGAAVLCV